MVDKIEALLLEKFQDEDFLDCFIIEIKLHENKKLDVFVDSDKGITIGQCARLNRYLQNHIDEEGWLGEKYVLDVSSPGVGKPLILKRQYPKNIGRKLEVKLKDGLGTEVGILKAIEENNIVLEQKFTEKQGKKKIRGVKDVNIDFESIERTIVKIMF